MGYTTTPYSVFASDMRQTPKTVEMVLDFAGWTFEEAAKETLIGPNLLRMAAEGKTELHPVHWKRLLDVAGRRAFDEGCDE